jgi:hypothetical protein
MTKVVPQSKASLVQCIAEIICPDSQLFAHHPNDSVWQIQDKCYKTRDALLEVGQKIVDGMANTDWFAIRKVIWNPKVEKTYRYEISDIHNPDACVCLVVRDGLGEVHEVSISAFGTINIEGEFPNNVEWLKVLPTKIADDTCF